MISAWLRTFMCRLWTAEQDQIESWQHLGPDLWSIKDDGLAGTAGMMSGTLPEAWVLWQVAVRAEEMFKGL